MNGDRWYLKEKSPCDVLHKFERARLAEYHS